MISIRMEDLFLEQRRDGGVRVKLREKKRSRMGLPKLKVSPVDEDDLGRKVKR